ncbi:MAG: hypothetical protein LBR49_06520 [Tannerella sp.]|jgi:hypothetical protein|nr:hypothetical protein [Tannerella sp.]
MKWEKYKIVWLLLSVLWTGMSVQAQETLIDVRLDSADILIGEQTVLHLSVTIDNDKNVICPIPADTLMTGVEVLSVSDPDTIRIDNNRLVIKRDIQITSFDSLLYLLPPFMVIDGQDTVYSNQIALKVSTIPVDTEHPEQFFDIKNIWKPPFVWADYYPLIFGILLAIVLIIAIIYIVKRIRAQKSLIPFRKVEPKLAPHEEAYQELARIKQQKLWQQGRNKEYYTQLTDTLRRYLLRRYDIYAMEMTSYEILEVLPTVNDDPVVRDTLKQILHLADYVKFAKLKPLPDENDLSMSNAYAFVDRTKLVEEAKTTEGQAEGEDSEIAESKPIEKEE